MPELERLGDYTLREKIAEGGMGSVYLAWQESLQREVCVKVLKDTLGSDHGFVERFVREARHAASLDHPNIIQIHFVGEEQDKHYFAMEYVRGEDLKQHVRKNSRLSVVESLDIIIKVADALACAAEAGIIHRDIKPENIMVTPHGRVKVTDFGLAKSYVGDTTGLTQPGRVLGTVNYMSPEQGLGKEVDSRSDIYSLGVVFFELLAGRPPFKGDHPTSIIYMHVYEPPPPIRQVNRSVPVEIEQLLMRMMSKDPEDRPADPTTLISELEAVRKECGLQPMNRREPTPDEATERVLAVNQGAPLCLVVEDDEDVSDLTEQVLNRMNLNVICAKDGIEGLTMWRTYHPDLVLLDLMMPNLSGLAVLEERRQQRLEGKVLVISALQDWHTIQRTAQQFVDGYLLKPYLPSSLEAKVRELLGMKRKTSTPSATA